MKLILDENKATLDAELIAAINATAGDRVEIQCIDMNGTLIPSIFVSEGGNKLTKSNTIVCKGEKRNLLAQFGSNFVAENINGLVVLHGDGNVVFTTTQKAVKERTIDLKQLLDTQFKLNAFEYEL
ncbi:MAG: hypothetical protein Q4C49_00795 [Bacillota bacterium]|nr:hypothetical protein [Bacillota bacterium]